MELVYDQGKVYGARYYTVQPKFPAHALTWFKPEWAEMVAWCVDTYGPTHKDGVFEPNQRWYINDTRFWFREEEDVLVFALRWSG